MSCKETNILLNGSHNSNYQTYHDDLPSIEILNEEDELHVMQKSKSRRNTCKVCVGRLLQHFEPYLKWLKRIYYVILCNSGIVCLLLIISRIFSRGTSAADNLFHSSIFMSDSPPLLLTANIVMIVSYSLENFLALRICLAVGCSCFALWGLTNDPLLLDTAMFNTVMMLLNLHHAVILSYRYRHIEFDASLEQIYVEIFDGYLNRVDFNQLVDISYKRKMTKGEIFKKKDDEVTSLCCLVSGRIKVVREHKVDSSISNTPSLLSPDAKKTSPAQALHKKYSISADDADIGCFLRDPHFVNLCHKNQFIEAPQWVHANLKPHGHRFTVSFIAIDDCQYIKWPKENLIELIENNSDIYHALSGVLGMHTAHALLKSREYSKFRKYATARKLTEDANNDIDNNSKQQ